MQKLIGNKKNDKKIKIVPSSSLIYHKKYSFYRHHKHNNCVFRWAQTYFISLSLLATPKTDTPTKIEKLLLS